MWSKVRDEEVRDRGIKGTASVRHCEEPTARSARKKSIFFIIANTGLPRHAHYVRFLAMTKPFTTHKSPYTKKGFSLIEALIATAIVGIAFVGVYSLVATSEQFTKWAIARQKLQLIADQIFEVIDGDVENITSYNLDLTTCTDPTPATNTYLLRSYEWCVRMQNELFAAGTTNVRAITVTTSGTKYIVLVHLEAYDARAQVIMERVYGN